MLFWTNYVYPGIHVEEFLQEFLPRNKSAGGISMHILSVDQLGELTSLQCWVLHSRMIDVSINLDLWHLSQLLFCLHILWLISSSFVFDAVTNGCLLKSRFVWYVEMQLIYLLTFVIQQLLQILVNFVGIIDSFAPSFSIHIFFLNSYWLG